MNLPDSDAALRGWLHALTPVTALVAQRSFFAMPKQDTPVLPFIVFYRVAGVPDEHGQDYPDYIFECWGVNKHAASQLALTLAGVIIDENSYRPNPIYAGVRIKAGRINAGPVQNSGTGNAKRYRLDATFHMCSV